MYIYIYIYIYLFIFFKNILKLKKNFYKIKLYDSCTLDYTAYNKNQYCKTDNIEML